MPCTLLPFKPDYKLKTTAIENANGFQIEGVDWTAQAKVQVHEPGTNHTIKVGFIQAVKAYEMKVDYRDSILESKLDWTPMCDRESGQASPWYEESAFETGFGWSPEVTGPTARPVLVTPKMGDHPCAPIDWQDEAHRRAAGNDVQRARRKEQFQTWLVAHDEDADTWTTLYCFSYSIDQVVSIDLSKPIGSRCKVEVGASTQASAPTCYCSAPFPKIPTFRAGCANDNDRSTYTVRR